MIILLSIVFIGMILFPSVSFHGALTGMNLWALKVFPALFPAMLITTCIMELIPAKSAFAYVYIVLSGIFCGYPAGAFACARYHQGNPEETLCPAIMGYCNISGTAFVMNYIYFANLKGMVSLLPLLCIIYLPPVLLLAVAFMRHSYEERQHIHQKQFLQARQFLHSKNHSLKKKSFAEIFNDAVTISVENSLKLGGYIIFFSCISAYLVNIFSFQPILALICCNLVEITNGIGLTAATELSIPLKLLLITGMNSFGGISTIMQTSAVITGSGLKIKRYIYQKLLCALLTFVVAAAFIYVPFLHF